MTGVSADSRNVRKGDLFFALTGARVDGHDFVAEAFLGGAAGVVVQREVNVAPELRDRVVRVADTRRALCDSAREYRRRWGGLVIAVTGSNGKTTTREMLHHILSAVLPCQRSPKSYNTDVGVPLTLFRADASHRALIVEMGTNAPGEIAALAAIAEPNLAVITNVAESHLEGLGSVQGVADAKGELLDALGQRGVAFLNADDRWFAYFSRRHAGRSIAYGLSEKAEFACQDLCRESWGHRFAIRGIGFELRVPGRHNVLNALASLAVADHLGVDLRVAAERLASFRPPEMRFQREEFDGVTVIADCYNANPGSVRAALAEFREMDAAGRKVAVFGDMLELGGQTERLHADIGAEAAKSGLDALWAVGRFSKHIVRSARESGLSGTAMDTPDVESAAVQIGKFLRPGDVLLVKGSRSMRMERLIEQLRKRSEAGRPVEA